MWCREEFGAEFINSSSEYIECGESVFFVDHLFPRLSLDLLPRLSLLKFPKRICMV